MIDISYIVPVYNLQEEELSNCIESIAKQTSGNNEIIIVDDGSTNGIQTYCDSLGSQYNFTVIHQLNQGLAVARNTGLNEAHGEWIVHVDGDDWVDIHLSEELLKASRMKRRDIFVWGFILATGDYRRELILKDKNAFDVPYEEIKEKVLSSILDYDRTFRDLSINTSWGKAYRRDFLVDNNLYYDPQLRRAQDAAYNLRAFNRASSVGYIDKALNYYRNDNVSLSRGYNPKTLEYLIATAMSVRSFVSNESTSEVVKQASNMFIQRLFRMINTQYFQHKDNNQSYRQRKKLFLDTIEREPFKSAFSSGMTRSGVVFQIADKLFQRKQYGLLLVYNRLFALAYKIKMIGR